VVTVSLLIGGASRSKPIHEPAVGRGGGQHLAVDIDQGAGRGAADGVAALDELARQRQARRGGVS
jgi:hypothetical protein